MSFFDFTSDGSPNGQSRLAPRRQMRQMSGFSFPPYLSSICTSPKAGSCNLLVCLTNSFRGGEVIGVSASALSLAPHGPYHTAIGLLQPAPSPGIGHAFKPFTDSDTFLSATKSLSQKQLLSAITLPDRDNEYTARTACSGCLVCQGPCRVLVYRGPCRILVRHGSYRVDARRLHRRVNLPTRGGTGCGNEDAGRRARSPTPAGDRP